MRKVFWAIFWVAYVITVSIIAGIVLWWFAVKAVSNP